MAFRNAKFIELLRERGETIKKNTWKRQKQIEDKINKIKSKECEELMTPCSIFMTFETEEGINRALIFDDAIKADKSLENLQYWI